MTLFFDLFYTSNNIWSTLMDFNMSFLNLN